MQSTFQIVFFNLIDDFQSECFIFFNVFLFIVFINLSKRVVLNLPFLTVVFIATQIKITSNIFPCRTTNKIMNCQTE